MALVELVYITADKQVVHFHLPLQEGDRVGDVIAASGIHQQYPETIGLALGIFSKGVSMDTPLRAGDRIELYRPLSLDPKDNRRRRALKKA